MLNIIMITVIIILIIYWRNNNSGNKCVGDACFSNILAPREGHKSIILISGSGSQIYCRGTFGYS